VSHRSPLPDVDIPDVPLTTYVLGSAGERADKTALIDGPTGRVMTYGELDQATRRLAGGLQAKGFGKGDVLAIMAPNLPEYAVVFHGVAMAGGTITTINPSYTEREIHHQLEDAGATLLVTVPGTLETASAAAKGTGVTEVCVIGQAEGTPSLEDWMGEPLSAQVPVTGDDVVALPYSSGTTGLSKGAFYHHFRSKEELLEAIAARFARESLGFIQALQADTQLDALRRLNLLLSLGRDWKREHIAELKACTKATGSRVPAGASP